MTQPPPAPEEFVAEPLMLSEVAGRYSLSLVGPDREIVAFGTIKSSSAHRDRLLTYAISADYLAAVSDSEIAGCVTHESLLDSLPSRVSALVTSGDPTDAFYTIFSDTVRAGRWSTLSDHRGAGTAVAPSARIHSSVVIGDGCSIMDNVVIMPGTYIGDRVTIKPNATVGGDGFQVPSISGRRMMVPHAGGVVIGSDVSIGSQACVDRGLFGEMTTIGDRSAIDNLVQIAHSVRIGADCAIVAGGTVCGSVTVGDAALLGAQCVISPSVSVGHHALIGAGSAVGHDVPPQAVVYGVPARVWGWQCVCGARLDVIDGSAVCGTCGSRFETGPSGLVPAGGCAAAPEQP